MARNPAVLVSLISDWDGKDLDRGIKELEKARAATQTMSDRVGAFGTKIQNVGKQVSNVGGSLTKGLTLPILAGGAALVAFANEAEQAAISNAKLGSVLESMGYPEATRRVSDYAEQLERSLAIDADVIRATQTKLATFKNLTASVNESGGAFDRATMAALDLAAAGFGSAESNATQLGKALQDPVKGITALARAGVTFTAQEKKKIEELVKSGKLLEAQNIVLSAIESQVGGTAAAGASAFERIRLSLLQVAEAIGTAVLPLIQQLADFIANELVPSVLPKVESLVDSFNKMDPTLKKVIGVALAVAAALGPVLLIAGKLITAVGGAITIFSGFTVAGVILAAKIIAIVAAIAAVVIAFKEMYDRSEVLRNAVTNLISTVKNIATTLLGDVVSAFRSVTGEAGSVRSIFERVARVAGDILGGALEILTNYWNILANGVRVVIKIFEAAFKIFQMVATIIRGALILAFDILLNRLGPISTALRAVANGVRTAFSNIATVVAGAFNSVMPAIAGFINFAIRGINKLIDGYNTLEGKIPGITRIGRIAEFTFQNLAVSTAAAAKSSTQLANEANAARYTAMAGVTNWDAYNEALGRTSGTTGDLSLGLDDVKKKTGGADEQAKKFKERLKELRDELSKAIEAANQYRQNVSDQIVGVLSLGKAYDDYTARQKAVTDTLAELTKYQSEIQGEATEDQKRRLLELQKAYQDAQTAAANGAQSIIGEFEEQGKRAKAFTDNLQLLLKNNLSRSAFDAILREGGQRGADIAAAMAEGNVAENVKRINDVYDSVKFMGDQVGAQASTNFMTQGIILAQSMLIGFIREFMPAGKKRRELLDAVNGMVSEALASLAKLTNVPMPTFSGGGGGGGGGGPSIETTTAAPAAPVVEVRPLGAYTPPLPSMAPVIPSGEGRIFAELQALNRGRAKGGPVLPNELYAVGEMGPELFVPSVPGTIIPNNRLMGGSTNVVINVNAGMGTNGAEVGRQIVDALKAYERRNGAVYVSA